MAGNRFVHVIGRRSPIGMVVLAIGAVLLLCAPAYGYIGPGAGIAVGTTVVALFLAFLSAITAIFLWPVRLVIRSIRWSRVQRRARVKRVVILGLDGMEPTLAEKYMSEGKLPNLSALKERGSFLRLGTTAPPLSPVAWSSFLTGCNPGKHGIFDFLTRDRRTYLPKISSVGIHAGGGSRLGRLFRGGGGGRPVMRLLRKGTPFWKILGEHGVFSNVIRVPITFPPERFRGVSLSAMCVPDLRGTQGTFSLYTTRAAAEDEYIGGERIVMERNGRVVRSNLIGPADEGEPDASPLLCPFEITRNGAGTAALKVNGHTVELARGRYTPWVEVAFGNRWGRKVRGICQFLLLQTEPDLELYVTPVQIDPDRPVMPISYPAVYATYLSKRQGKYATLGLAEDTWGLNMGVLDDETFLEQCTQADREREEMFFDALDKVRHGLCVCVFDGTDRIQHMFWRYLEDDHPARRSPTKNARPDAIENLYRHMDELVGRTVRACDDRDTVLMVISDHGFNAFRRGVDLNAWLEQNGYLRLLPGGRGKKYLGGVDWSQTRAYCLGLAGIWLNIKGRESQGIVAPEEADALRQEICGKLTALRDEERNEMAVRRAFVADDTYVGPYKADGPDIILGYNRGYRVSWEAAIGQPTDRVFHDNTKPWSGDHCIDPKLIPGVLFCNRKVGSKNPRLMDLGPTALDLFGITVPRYLDGRALSIADADGRFDAQDGGADLTSVAGGRKQREEPATA